MTGLTIQISEYIARTQFDDIPNPSRHAAERSLLDALGVMLAATTLGEGCTPFADLSEGADQQTAKCTVLGRPWRAHPLQAAAANGALAHAIDFEDALDGAPIHPNAAIIPVVMALCEADPEITGRQLVTAIAVGCDVCCRMGMALDVNPDEFGWYPPPILSAFAAAAAASSLLKLDATRTAHALALTLAQATYSSEFKTFPDSTLRAVRDAFSAHAGLNAVLLAARGVSGHLTALEGKAGFFNLFARGQFDSGRLLADLGTSFWGEHLSFKLWPSCRGTHAFIEAALSIRASIPDPLADIEEIHASGAPFLEMLTHPRPQKFRPATAIDAKFSLPYCIAAALIDGAVTLPTFMEDHRTNPDLLALAARVRFKPDPKRTMRDAAAGRLRLKLKDGRTIEQDVAQARGAPDNPLTDENLAEKFRDCATYASRQIAPSLLTRIISGALSARRLTSAATLFAHLRGNEPC